MAAALAVCCVASFLMRRRFRRKSYVRNGVMDLVSGSKKRGGAKTVQDRQKEKRQRLAIMTSGENLVIANAKNQNVSEDECDLENFDSLSNDNDVDQISDSEAMSRISMSNGEINISMEDDKGIKGIKKALDNLIEAVKEGNRILEMCLPRVYSEEEVYAELKNIGVEPPLLVRSYIYLVQNPDMTRGFFGCPSNRRREVLMEMMFGSQGP